MEAHATSLLKSSYDIVDAGKVVASLNHSMWREKGEIKTPDHSFQVIRNGVVSGQFQLKLEDDVVATATRLSLWKQQYRIDINGDQYELKASSFFGRAFELTQNNKVIVRVKTKGWLSRSFSIDTPETLLPTTLWFCCWMVTLLWQRQAQAAG